MGRGEQDRADAVPHFPDFIISMAACWRAIGDAQTEVDPFGANYRALGEAREAIEAAVDRLTGQRGFLALASPGAAQGRHPPVLAVGDGRAVP